MRNLGKALFVIGYGGLALQIFEIWLGLTGLPITRDHMLYAMLWWSAFGIAAAGGTLILYRDRPPE